MKIRLLHVASSYHIGLTNQETQLAIAYREFEELDALVVTGENEQYVGCFSQLRNNNISFKTINGFDEHGNLFQLVENFTKIILDINPEVVTVNTNWQLLIAGLSRQKSKVPYRIIYTIHGFRHNHKIKSIIARYLISVLLWVFADAIIAPSSYVARKFAFLKSRIIQIPLGEDRDFFNKSAAPNFSRGINFCFPGEFRSGKNQALLIEAFIEFIKKAENKSSMLYLPGSGDLLGEMVKKAEESGFSDRIRFPGQLDRAAMLDLYNHCQVAVIPSNDETFGHCIAEPLVLQRIVVTRPVGLALDHIVDGTNGYLFDTKDDLVKIFIHIANLESNKLIAMSGAAKITGEKFNWKNVAKRIIDEVVKPLVKLLP